MKSKLKTMISVLLSVIMIFAMTVVSNADEIDLYNGYIDTLENGTALVSDLYDDSNINTNEGSFSTGKFKATKDAGDHIRVWFRNDGTQAVTVKLIRYTNLGLSKDTVLTFSVGAGNNIYRAYNVDGADNGTYQVVITPNSGSKVKGYLRVRQY